MNCGVSRPARTSSRKSSGWASCGWRVGRPAPGSGRDHGAGAPSRERPRGPVRRRFRAIRPGYRVLINSLGSSDRTALALGLPTGRTWKELVPLWRAADAEHPADPAGVRDGRADHGERAARRRRGPPEVPDAVLARARRRALHRHRRRWTSCRDPDSDWVNVGTYRVMLQSTATTSGLSTSRRASTAASSATSTSRAGKPMPGGDVLRPRPAAVHGELAWRCRSACREYDWAGGVSGEPVHGAQGPADRPADPRRGRDRPRGLHPPRRRGARGAVRRVDGLLRQRLARRAGDDVEAVYHRNDPIILGSPPGKPPTS